MSCLPTRSLPRGTSGDVLALSYTPDGRMLVTAGSDGLAKIWEVATRTVRSDLTGHEGKVLRVAISSDGKTIATAGEDRTVRLWSTADGARLGTLSGHSGAVTALAFSPDNKTLASGGPDTTIRLWDVAAGRALRTLEGHEFGVEGLAFAPDGKTLASASRDATVRLWDMVVERPSTILGKHNEPALCVAFAPNGKTVVSGGEDQTVRFWPIGEAESKPPQQGPQPQGPQGPQPQQTGRRRPCQSATMCSRSPSPDGKTLAAAVSDAQAARADPGSVVIVDARTREIIGSSLKGHLGMVRALAFAPDGKTIATSGADRAIRLWELASRTTRAVWLGPGPRTRARPDHDATRPGGGAGVPPDGKTVATATGSPIVTFWDVATHEVVRRLRDPSGAVRALAISPDGVTAAFGGDGQIVRLWDLAAGRERAVLKGHEGAITYLSFAPTARPSPRGAWTPPRSSGTSPRAPSE